MSNRFNKIRDGPGKPADGFGINELNFSVCTIFQHSLELWPFVGKTAGLSKVSIAADIFKFLICSNELFKIFFLELIASFLCLTVRTRTDVGAGFNSFHLLLLSASSWCFL